MSPTFSKTPAEFKKLLIAALALDLPYLERPKTAQAIRQLGLTGTQAAVVVLIGWNKTGADQKSEPHLLLTRRAEDVETHRGQIAFPGGVAEEGETQQVTALRELQEEVGIMPDGIEILDILPPLSTLSTRFWITPVVGIHSKPIEEIKLTPQKTEIEEAVWISLRELSDPKVYKRETFESSNVRVPNHVFRVAKLEQGRHPIWGATGAMIRNLLDRIAKVV